MWGRGSGCRTSNSTELATEVRDVYNTYNMKHGCCSSGGASPNATALQVYGPGSRLPVKLRGCTQAGGACGLPQHRAAATWVAGCWARAAPARARQRSCSSC